MLKAGSAARRVSLRPEAPLVGGAVVALVEGFLHDVDRQLQTIAPAWVGHLKLLVDVDGAVVYGSLTMAGDDVRWTGAMVPSVPRAELTAYAAIYNLLDEDVAAALDAHLAALAPLPTT